MYCWEDVEYECTLKSAWCEIPVIGSYMERAKVDLAIVSYDGFMGVVQTEYATLDGEEVACMQHTIVPCYYDSLEFVKTGLGVFLLVEEENEKGVLALKAASSDKNSVIFSESLISVEYDDIKYRSGTPGSFILQKNGTTLEYDLLTKEIRMIL